MADMVVKLKFEACAQNSTKKEINIYLYIFTGNYSVIAVSILDLED
ncbi:MAG: hypothetical protein MJE63_20860 [Proteobacteria bacterium]|nr:hypothetical protein [Pseudomonadota bacterium]